MLTGYFLFKLILTPLIILTATLVARRWGERIGGLLIGRPLTSGPVSVFFAIEQGRAYAQHAATSAMLGLVPVAVFCSAYVWSARQLAARKLGERQVAGSRDAWYVAPMVAISLYLAAVWSISRISPGLGLTAGLVGLALILAILFVGRPAGAVVKISSPWWDLPLRITLATALLLFITGAAAALGPTWGGLLSPFPIFTFVMATFSHRSGGTLAAWSLIRGVLTGLFSYAAFFIVVTLLIERASLPVVYSLATLSALGLNSLNLVAYLWRRRAARSQA